MLLPVITPNIAMSVKDLIILGCSSQQPTRYRNHGAYLVRFNQQGLLFDPGEGTQRQFIFANVAPTCVNHIFISHFHGDHCLGLGSMLMRLNLDKVTHPIHCHYPASGKKYFDRLRYGTIYKESIEVIEHPVSHKGVVFEDPFIKVEAEFLHHRVDNIGWKITEPDRVKYDATKLNALGIKGNAMKEFIQKGKIQIQDQLISIEEVSWVQPGESFAVIMDTSMSETLISLAKGCSILLCESTFLDKDLHLAEKYHHLTAKQAATIADRAEVKLLILTHFSARYSDLHFFLEEARAIFPHTEIGEDLKIFNFPKKIH